MAPFSLLIVPKSKLYDCINNSMTGFYFLGAVGPFISLTQTPDK